MLDEDINPTIVTSRRNQNEVPMRCILNCRVSHDMYSSFIYRQYLSRGSMVIQCEGDEWRFQGRNQPDQLASLHASPFCDAEVALSQLPPSS